VLKDVSFRIVPVTARDAREMIREIKGYPILEGYRGQKPASIPALEKLIVKISQFVEKNPQIRELDLNPIFAYPDKAVAVDARIILE
jgi:acyl-CoA synthetase (NDP forming)